MAGSELIVPGSHFSLKMQFPKEKIMARKDLNPKVDRRQFLAGAIAAGAASAISSPNAVAAEPAKPAPRAPSALPPSAKTAAAESAIPLLNQ